MNMLLQHILPSDRKLQNLQAAASLVFGSLSTVVMHSRSIGIFVTHNTTLIKHTLIKNIVKCHHIYNHSSPISTCMLVLQNLINTPLRCYRSNTTPEWFERVFCFAPQTWNAAHITFNKHCISIGPSPHVPPPSVVHLAVRLSDNYRSENDQLEGKYSHSHYIYMNT